jgi:hypothetical protein
LFCLDVTVRVVELTVELGSSSFTHASALAVMVCCGAAQVAVTLETVAVAVFDVTVVEPSDALAVAVFTKEAAPASVVVV